MASEKPAVRRTFTALPLLVQTGENPRPMAIGPSGLRSALICGELEHVDGAGDGCPIARTGGAPGVLGGTPAVQHR